METTLSYYVKVTVGDKDDSIIELDSAREALAAFDKEIYRVSNSKNYPFGITGVDVFAVLEKSDIRIKETWVKRAYH